MHAASEQQVGHIHTGDHKNQNHSAENGKQRRLYSAREIGLQGNDRKLSMRIIRFRVLLFQYSLSDRINLTSRLVHADSWSETAHGAQMMSPGSSLRHGILQRRPKPRLWSHHILKPSRHPPDPAIHIAFTKTTALAALPLPP